MTRVCVTWDREETARLIGRCREALAADCVTERLAHNAVLSAVLDGIAATLGNGYRSRLHDVEHALTSLAAIAEALGVQEAGT